MSAELCSHKMHRAITQAYDRLRINLYLMGRRQVQGSKANRLGSYKAGKLEGFKALKLPGFLASRHPSFKPMTNELSAMSCLPDT
jgi:hypothetical protein